MLTRDHASPDRPSHAASTASLAGRHAAETQPAMRAIVQREYGSADTLRPETVDRPSPAPGEVLIRVRSAAMDRGTWHLMTGTPYLMRVMGFGFRRPANLVPGLDVSGVVVGIGAGVSRFAIGDEVFGVSRGSFAEYAVAREDKLAHKPREIGFEQAAALGISALTALTAVRDVAHVEAGQRVLVVGASGGVGTYAVQLAVAMGAHVTAVCSAGKVGLVRSLGAERVLAYEHEDFADGSSRYDVLIDIGGMSSVSRMRRALTPTGTLVIVGGEGGGTWSPGLGRQLLALALSPFVSQRLRVAACKEHHTGLEHLAGLAAAGKVVPVIERSYALGEVPDAMRHLEAGRARGKLVVRVSDT